MSDLLSLSKAFYLNGRPVNWGRRVFQEVSAENGTFFYLRERERLERWKNRK